MTERERGQDYDEQPVDEVRDAPTHRGEDVAGKIDDLLDEIDSVLEENAEEFVKNYVQKGGQ